MNPELLEGGCLDPANMEALPPGDIEIDALAAWYENAPTDEDFDDDEKD